MHCTRGFESHRLLYLNYKAPRLENIIITNNKMGCDYYVYKVLKINLKKGVAFIELSMKREYWGDGPLYDSDDSDYEIKNDGWYKHFLKIKTKPVLVDLSKYADLINEHIKNQDFNDYTTDDYNEYDPDTICKCTPFTDINDIINIYEVEIKKRS